LPIGNGQTISQPTTQARYLEALNLTGQERALEIGTGSGYQAALLSLLVSHVVTVERVPELASTARQNLERAKVHSVLVVVGDGSIGWASESPYDAMLVAAACPEIPKPLERQLADGGRLVIPLERSGSQLLFLVSKIAGHLTEEEMGPAQFVPLVGRHGFPEPPRDRGRTACD
jgi:protein-L-isoaspartate(D-aspartate) O-methyltransferase